MRLQHRSSLTLALLPMCCAAPVWAQTAPVLAQTDGPLVLKAETSLHFDNNLFRLPAGANTTALIGKPSAAETININSLSLNFSTTLSLQKFEVAINVTDYRYQNFNYLSFVGHNYNAAWRWALTPHLHGNLVSQRQEAPNSYVDYQGYNVQNLTTNTNTRLDAVYEPGGAWGIHTGVSQSAQTNQQNVLAVSNYTDKSVDLGLGYAYASGSTISYTLKNTDGTYLDRVLPSVGLYDDGFKQIDNELRLHWVITGKSTADLYTTHISRTNPHYAERDYSGLNAGANFNWNITGKSALAASWTRELSDYQTIYSNYIQTDRIWLGPLWQLSPKTVVRLRYEVAQSDYLGSPFGPVVNQRSDTTTDASLSLIWQPYQYLTLSTSLENATRRSNFAGLDYESKMATVSAQFSY